MPETDDTARPLADTAKRLRLEPAALRWRCDPERLPFETTDDLEPLEGVIGQDDAIEALRFGLEIYAPGQNVYVRGLSGTGRLTVVSRLLKEIQPACPLAADHAYVHDFERRDRPRLLTLPRGRGAAFRDRVAELVEFIRDDLGPALAAESTQARREVLEAGLEQRSKALTAPFEEELRAQGLAMITIRVGDGIQPAMVPLIDGTPAPPEQLQALRQEGKLDDEAAEKIQASLQAFAPRFNELTRELRKLQREHAERIRGLYQGEARSLLGARTAELQEEFPGEDVATFLREVQDDLVDHRLRHLQEAKAFTRLYEVNLVLGHSPEEPCPIIVETMPTLANLFGTIEREILPGGTVRSDHLMINAGSLLRAQGGYLVLEALEVLREPGVWKALVRALRSGRLAIGATDGGIPWAVSSLKPEPIPLEVKIILIGDPGLYHALDAGDPDFPHLFKVLADFDDSIQADDAGLDGYARLFARIAREEGLPPFESSAIAGLAEHGARIAARNDRLTTRFGRLVDIAREAAFLTNKGAETRVRLEEVREAVHRSRRRADLPARRFREFVRKGGIRIDTRGEVVGQVNGLAVIGAGPLTYGFPARITSTIGPGTAGAINIEREADLSGSIHTKGFYILGGLLRYLLRTDHPLAFSASIAFEQSYGGIDGDSASGAEMCCLLSALTDIPLRQDLAMTGSIDQFGHIQPIGAATEKIEGFYDTCLDGGLTGTQGVIVPRANLENLMLRHDVVEACERGQFHVYAVDCITEALEVFTGIVAGQPNGTGEYPEGTILREAVDRAFAYWLLAARPATEWIDGDEEEEQEEEAPAPQRAAQPTPENE